MVLQSWCLGRVRQCYEASATSVVVASAVAVASAATHVVVEYVTHLLRLMAQLQLALQHVGGAFLRCALGVALLLLGGAMTGCTRAWVFACAVERDACSP